MKEEVEGRCDCFGDDCSGEVEYVADPYIEDIEGEIVMKWLCQYHYQAYCDDI